jgi:hypothetical protein
MFIYYLIIKDHIKKLVVKGDSFNKVLVNKPNFNFE